MNEQPSNPGQPADLRPRAEAQPRTPAGARLDELTPAQVRQFALSNINERKQTEARLRESEANLLAFFDSPGLMRGIVELVPGDILHILDNAASAQFFGRTVADLHHQLASKLGVPSETIRLWSQRYTESARTGQPVHFEYRHGTGSGLRCFQVTVSHLGQGLHGPRHAYVIANVTEQRQAEEALRNEHERLEAVLKGTQAGIWEWNIPTGLTVFNERWAQILGYTLAELAPVSIKTWEALVHPEDLQCSKKLLQQHFAGELDFYECECRMRHKDGRWVWVHDRGCVSTRTADGQPLLMFGTHIDITARKRAEELLRISQENLLLATEGAKLGVWNWNIATGELIFSARCKALFGIRPDEALSYQRYLDALHPDDREKTGLVVKEALDDHKEYDIEYRSLWPDGSLHWLAAKGRGYYDATGKAIRMEGVALDITGRKQAEDQLRESESALLEAQSIAGVGSYVLDIPAGSWTSSATLDRIFGIDAGCDRTVTGWMNLVHPDDRTLMADYLHNIVLGQHQAFDKTYRILRHDDQRVGWVHGLGRLDYDAQGRCLRLSGTIQDITARKQAEAERAQLEAQTWQLQKAESLGRMAGAIAHHFNNQLQVVAGNLELIGIPQDASVAECLHEAMQATRQASKISRLMLTYLGRTTDKQSPVDAAELCRQGLSLFQSSTRVVVQTDLPEPGPVILASAPQFQQMLTNLLTNAAESGRLDPGAIRLFVKTVSARELPAAHRFPLDWQPQAQDYVCLGVADAGCGISPENLDKIFDPFFSSKFTGRGLGLSVVLGLVRAHHGCITVESAPGQGSTFQLFFPALSRAALPPPQPCPAPQFTAGGTVLLVDDDQPVLKLAEAMLVRLGFTVLTAANGSEAVDLFRQHQAGIRCVLTDLSMPGLDGWATLAALRALRAELPVILSSGHDEALVRASVHAEQPAGTPAPEQAGQPIPPEGAP